MIDRLVIFLLLAGCLMFGAVVLLELEPAGTDNTATKRDCKTWRYPSGRAPTAERGSMTSSPKPSPNRCSQHAMSSAELPPITTLSVPTSLTRD